MGSVPWSAREVAAYEANAVALGVSLDQLMENAGRVIAEEAGRHLPAPPSPVAIVAGSGNNGGDGTAAAFYLGQWGHSPEIWLLRSPSEIRTPMARSRFDRIGSKYRTHIGIPSPSDLRQFPLIIDALLGTGQGGPLRSPYLETAEAMAESKVPVLSIDVPSGLGDPKGVRPRWTVALQALKEGMDTADSGEVVVRDVGIPSEAHTRTGPGEFLFFPTPSSVRGRNGRVAVIGGGPFSGAPALAALSALRSGAERAVVIAPEPAATHIQSFAPDLIVRAAGRDRFERGDAAQVEAILVDQRVTSVAVGMGAGRDAETVAFFHGALPGFAAHGPVVVDADALPALTVATEKPALGPGRVIATPNRPELSHVFGIVPSGAFEDQLEVVRAAAAEHHVTIVAKGEVDLLSDGQRVAANQTHHVAGTVGGAGDVLSGCLTALLGAGASTWEAARLGTYWVGSASARVFDRKSYGLTASDMAHELGETLADGLRRVESFRRGGTSVQA